MLVCRSRSHGSYLLSLLFLSFLHFKFVRYFLNTGGIKAYPSPPPNCLRGTIPPVPPPKSPPLVKIGAALPNLFQNKTGYPFLGPPCIDANIEMAYRVLLSHRPNLKVGVCYTMIYLSCQYVKKGIIMLII